MIKDPNSIVEKLVADVRTVFGDHLLSVVLYGSAVTHEFVPGKSDVNITLVADALPQDLLDTGAAVLRGWMRRGVAVPLFLTPADLAVLPEYYPVEFLAIQRTHRILWGEDCFSGIPISRTGLRRQCRRELAGMVVQLRKDYLRYGGRPSELSGVLEQTVQAVLPMFMAIVLLHDRTVPSAKTELIAAVEDLFGLGASVLSEVYNRSGPVTAEKCVAEFNRLVGVIDMIANRMNATPAETEIPVCSGEESPFVPVDR